jgi:SAM-dependent methyltransferase
MFDSNIPSMESYNIEMRKSMIDKIFFLDKVTTKVIVDFGCADGSTIAFMNILFPEYTYIGYDLSDEMITIAKKKCPFAHFFSDWNKLQEFLETTERPRTVVCNSLIHEVYAYGSPNDVKIFWDRIYSESFDWVVIRDMAVSDSVTRKSDPLSVIRVRKNYNSDVLAQFERKWGSINENWPLVHFLLKYRYKTNWSREVNENYLPISLEDMINLIPKNWDPIDFKHYVLPFIRQKVREDFNIDLQDSTHVQLILKRI